MSAVNELLRNPPAWVVLLGIVWAVAFTIKHVMAEARRGQVRLIETLEVALVLMISGLIYHIEFARGFSVSGHGEDALVSALISLVVLLVLFALMSMIIYLIYVKIRQRL